MTTRRQFLKSGLLGAGASALSTEVLTSDVFAGSTAKTPTRFIFIHKGNGLLPSAMVPPSFGKEQLENEKKKGDKN